MPKQNDSRLYLYGVLNSIHIWLLILAVIGFAKKHLSFNNRFLKFTNQAVYPFYILHQTIIVAAGFYIVQLNIPIFLKLIILIPVTFISIFLIYSYIIKPFIITRILYGLKPKERDRNDATVL
jgi:glucans biosynthesis protein C